MPDTPAAPRDPTGWKPVQLVPENARSGRGGFPLRGGRESAGSRSGSRSTWSATGRPACTRGRSRSPPTGEASALPVELRVFDFALPDANSLNAMVYYEPDQPELYQGRNLDAAYHRFAHRHRVELVHAYDEATVEAQPRPLRRHGLHAGGGLRRPRRRHREHDRARVLLRSRPRAFGRRRARGSAPTPGWRSWRATLPNAVTFLYLPDEPYPPQYPEVRRLADNVRSNPGPGGKLPTFVTKRPVARAGRARSTSGACPLKPSTRRSRRRSAAKGRRVWAYNGARPRAPALLIDTPATEARASCPGPSSSTTSPLYFFWHSVHWKHNSQKQGERGAGRLGEPGHLRQPRPAAQARRRPGLPERRRRPALPGRGEAYTPRRTAASRGRSAPCSSPICAAASRTTST